MTDLDVDKIQEVANNLASDDSQVSYGIAVGNTILHWKQEQMIKKTLKWLKENAGMYWYDDIYVDCPDDLLEDFKKAIEEN